MNKPRLLKYYDIKRDKSNCLDVESDLTAVYWVKFSSGLLSDLFSAPASETGPQVERNVENGVLSKMILSNFKPNSFIKYQYIKIRM